jgi:hypothetical protein
MQDPFERLAGHPLTIDGPVTRLFQSARVLDFAGAARHLWQLPSDRSVQERSAQALLARLDRPHRCRAGAQPRASVAHPRGMHRGLVVGRALDAPERRMTAQPRRST